MAGLGVQRLPLLDLVAPRRSRPAPARSTPRGLDFYDRLVDELLAHGDRALR